jgi:hypothetical protein
MMRLKLCLFVILALDVAWGITRSPSKLLDPVDSVLLEASADTSGCVKALLQAGTCVPSIAKPFICGQGGCVQQGLTATCQTPGARSDKYGWKSSDPCGCNCMNTTIWFESAVCSALVSCTITSSQPTPPPAPKPQCPWAEWSDWGPCINPTDGSTPQCDYVTGVIPSGVQSRTRKTVAWSNCTGATQTDPMSCQPVCHPQECVQTAWQDLSVCPSCWDRTTDPFAPPQILSMSAIEVYPLFGGAQCHCPQFVDGICYQATDCQVSLCPRDCAVSEWSRWCECDKTCRDTRSDCLNCVGIQYRTREITTEPQDGGLACPPLSDSQSCNDTPCPIDCLLSTWTGWSTCTAKCGGGQQLRTRYILTAPQYNGKMCDDLYEYQDCATDNCPVSCQMGAWSDWDRTCPACVPEGTSPGVRTKTRNVTVEAQYGGSDCPPDSYQESCPTNYCPINCDYTPWTDWTDCNVTCGGGIQQRFRSVREPGRNGGTECTDDLYDFQVCNTKHCPVDCVYFWGPYHAHNSDLDCSAACGGGMQERDINIVVYPTADGIQCPPSPETQPCNTFCCPQPCQVGPWDRSEEDCANIPELCGLPCGDAFCTRHRNVTVYPKCGGQICPELSEYLPCKVKDCPAPCLWSEWSGWSLCPTCGDADPSIVQTRTRILLSGDPTMCQGTVGQTTDQRQCQLSPCPVDCTVTEFQDGPCSVSCGLGVYVRKRTSVGPFFGGASCPYLTEFDSCVLPACVPDCVVSDWSAWGPCTATCSSTPGVFPYQVRTRVLLVNSTKCSQTIELSDKQDCNKDPCPIPCILSPWTDWHPNPCGYVDGVQHCGLNLQTRHRDVITPASNGGRVCQITQDEQYCNGPPCENPCEFSPWSDWSFPSVSCNADPTNPAQVRRTRYLLNSADNDGSTCPHISETKNADILPCPVDCLFYYSDWGPCSPQGYRRRDVIISQYPSLTPPGRPCPKCRVERDDCTPPQPGDDECWLENCDSTGAGAP